MFSHTATISITNDPARRNVWFSASHAVLLPPTYAVIAALASNNPGK